MKVGSKVRQVYNTNVGLGVFGTIKSFISTTKAVVEWDAPSVIELTTEVIMNLKEVEPYSFKVGDQVILTGSALHDWKSKTTGIITRKDNESWVHIKWKTKKYPESSERVENIELVSIVYTQDHNTYTEELMNSLSKLEESYECGK